MLSYYPLNFPFLYFFLGKSSWGGLLSLTPHPTIKGRNTFLVIDSENGVMGTKRYCSRD
jgi:hypothetical protein